MNKMGGRGRGWQGTGRGKHIGEQPRIPPVEKKKNKCSCILISN